MLATSIEGITYPKDVLVDVINLENTLWYIYNKTGKLYFSVEVNLNKVIADETQNVDQTQYDPEIKGRFGKCYPPTFLMFMYGMTMSGVRINQRLSSRTSIR